MQIQSVPKTWKPLFVMPCLSLPGPKKTFLGKCTCATIALIKGPFSMLGKKTIKLAALLSLAQNSIMKFNYDLSLHILGNNFSQSEKLVGLYLLNNIIFIVNLRDN